jgi:hypothetical protein
VLPFPLAPCSLSENNSNRRFIQTGFFPELIDQVSFIRKMNRLGVVDKANDGGWFGGCLGAIVKLDAFTAVKRWFVSFNRPIQASVQLTG